VRPHHRLLFGLGRSCSQQEVAMISVTKLLGGASYFGDRLRYDQHSAAQTSGARPGSGPVVVWNATRTCNLECVHCYADAEIRRFAGELTTEEAQRMIEDLASINTPALLISGGEPLVRADILDLAEYATALGVRVTFSTNGTLIDKKKAERLAKIGVTYVGISIDGGEARHDTFRGKAGAFRDAIRGIRNCRAAGIRVGVRFTVTQENLGELETIFQVVENENIGRLCIYHLVYAGRGSYLAGIDLSVNEKRSMMNRLMEQVDRWNAEGRPVEVMTVDNHADGPYMYLRLRETQPERAEHALSLIRNNGGNRSGIAIGCIDSFGLVHPDQFTSHHTLGSIRERPFSEIWRDSRVGLLEGLRNRKALLRGRCATCNWLPVCNGNFRARAEAATGDYWQSDPGCYLLDSEITGEVAM
jgi:radical SAM protein with 4Fe4S-binding SPASM domain